MTEMERFSIKLSIRGYQVNKGIWEASIGEELPYRRSNGEVRTSLFRLISQHKGWLVIEDPVDPGHYQRDTGTIESYSERRLSTYSA